MANETEQKTVSSTKPSAGAILKASRKRLGLDLHHIAETLCIRYQYMLAIEEERYSELPGTTYAIGFVRAFAEHVELDGDEMIKRFKEEYSDLTDTPRLDFSEPASEASLPGKSMLFIALLIAGVAYGVWQWKSLPPVSSDVLISELPEKLAEDIAIKTKTKDETISIKQEIIVKDEQEVSIEKNNTITEHAPETVIQPEIIVVEKETPAVETTAIQLETENQEKEQTIDNAIETKIESALEAVEDKAEPEVITPQEYGLENKDSRIILITNSESWVQINKGEEVLLTRVLKKDDSYRVPNLDGITLMTGNAGGIDVFVDGKKVKPFGPLGTVRRDVILEPQHLIDGTAHPNQ
ncbi:MAG: DUF4115 domain-containing protein [Alphaproteobacteria bacterium]|nr:DUF4115 domain-containing protein [Alphaproteobacteria bacterium]